MARRTIFIDMRAKDPLHKQLLKQGAKYNVQFLEEILRYKRQIDKLHSIGVLSDTVQKAATLVLQRKLVKHVMWFDVRKFENNHVRK